MLINTMLLYEYLPRYVSTSRNLGRTRFEFRVPRNATMAFSLIFRMRQLYGNVPDSIMWRIN